MSQWRPAQIAWLSVISNIILVVLKIIVGVMIGSVAVISEAAHSAVDLVAALIALFAVRTSAKPADEQHPYGHGKFENASGTIEALLIFVAAGWIIYESVHRLVAPAPLEAPAAGAAVMAFSAVVNMIVSTMLFRVAEKHDSLALQADGWHLRTDVYTSAGVFVGLGVIQMHETFFPEFNLDWVDPVAAIGVAALIINAAYRLTIKSARDLMDVSLPPEEEQFIWRSLQEMAPRVKGFHKLRTRKSGAQRFVDVHMLVAPEMTVAEAHALADEAVERVKAGFPRANVIVHIEPADGQQQAERAGGLDPPEPED